MATRSLFQPKGAQALWIPLYEHMRDLSYGAVIPYEKLDELLGRDSRKDRQPIYRTQIELERHHHRTLIIVHGVGYKIAKPEEHRTKAESHRKRSYRQVTKARRSISSAPRELLSADEVRWLDETEIRLAQLESGLRHTNSRVLKLEQKSEVKDEVLDRIQADLKRLREKGLLD